MSGDMAVHP